LIDIHCHVLPGIDDGAEDLEMSAAMLRRAVKDNIKVVVATPHFNSENTTVEGFLEKRQNAYESLIPVAASIENCPKILLGAEVEASYELPMLQDVKKLCMQGTNFMLLEIPHMGYPEWMETLAFNLQARCAIVPIIAHPERNSWIKDKPNRLYKLCQSGVLSQVDVQGTAGNKSTAEFIGKLLSHNLVHFIASDAHDDNLRPLNISDYTQSFVDSKRKIDYRKELIDNAYKLIHDGFFNPSREPREFGMHSPDDKKNILHKKFSLRVDFFKDKKN